MRCSKLLTDVCHLPHAGSIAGHDRLGISKRTSISLDQALQNICGNRSKGPYKGSFNCACYVGNAEVFQVCERNLFIKVSRKLSIMNNDDRCVHHSSLRVTTTTAKCHGLEAHPCTFRWYCLTLLSEVSRNKLQMQQSSFLKSCFARAKHQGPLWLLFLWCAPC